MMPQPTPPSPPKSSFHASLSSHLHTANETCPLCEQEIPPEKLEEISGKIAARQRDQERKITDRLEQQYSIEKAQAEAKAKGDLELERRQSAIRESEVREEAKTAAEAAAAEKLAEAERAHHELQASLAQKIAAAETARATAEQAGADLTTQLEQLRQESERAIAAAKAEAVTREAEIRAEATLAAESGTAEKLAEAERIRQDLQQSLQQKIDDADAARKAAEQTGADLTTQLEQLRQQSETALAAAKAEAKTREAKILADATLAAESAVAEKLAATELSATEATAKAQEAESKLASFTENQEAVLAEQLNAQREIIEKAKNEEINAVKAKAFEENQKQVEKLNEMQRALEKKTNEELGEGAEVNLFEALKAEFPEDQITRIGKGVQGADILHAVMLNGKNCGTIIYDSKNHSQFRNDHVTKLRTDQIAAKAAHAILSTRKFPAKTAQLHIQDGVMLANPARVVALVTLVRQHMVQTHTLRMSSAERESKTAALYGFITSERCKQFFDRVDTNAEALLELQVKEQRFYQAAWKKEGELIRQLQKTQAELSSEISSIIGTAADPEMTLEEAAQ